MYLTLQQIYLCFLLYNWENKNYILHSYKVIVHFFIKSFIWEKVNLHVFFFIITGESHLSKLLTSDAKRGAFRKYDGATTPLNYQSMSPEERRQSFENNALSSADAPRRLMGGGRYTSILILFTIRLQL